MSQTITTLIVKLGSDITEALDGFSKTGIEAQKLGKQISSAGQTMTRNFTAPIMAAGAALGATAIHIGNAADVLFDLEQQTGLTTDQLQEFRRVATVAGVDQDTIAEAAMKLTNNLQAAGEESKQTSDALAMLGVSVKDADGNLRPMSELMPELITAMQGMDDVTRRNSLAADIFGRSWVNLAPVFGMTAEEMANAQREAHELGMVLGKDSLQAADDFRVQWQTMRDTMMGTVNQLGVALIPIMSAFVALLQEQVVPVVQALAGWLGDLSPVTQGLVAALAGLVAGIGPLLIVLGKVISMMPLLQAGFAAITGPVGLGVLAFGSLVAAGVALVENWGVIKYEVQRMVEGIREWLVGRFGGIVETVRGYAESIKGFFANMADVIVGHSIIPDMVDAVLEEFDRLGGEMGRSVEDTFDRGLDAIVDFATGSGRALEEFVRQAILDLTRLALKMLLVRAIMGATTGGASGFIDSNFLANLPGANGFGQFRAHGGRIHPGRAFNVAERGAELFVPDRPGVMVPLPAMAGGGAPASEILAQLGPIPRPMSPHEAATHAWYRELFRLALPDQSSRAGSR